MLRSCDGNHLLGAKVADKSAYHVLIAEHDDAAAPPVTLTTREGDLDAARGIANAMPYSLGLWAIVILVFAACYYLAV